MRKIPSIFENPIDNLLIDLAEILSKFHRQLDLTPNILTTFSLILSILAGIFLYLNYHILAAFLYLASYFYDCMDGYFARKYNMATTFGCYYDHIADVSKILFLCLIFYIKNAVKFFTILPIIIIFFILTVVHLGCQELSTPTILRSKSLEITTIACPNQKYPESVLPYTRFFGTGTFTLLIIYFILTY